MPATPWPNVPPEMAETTRLESPSAAVSFAKTSPVVSPLSLLLLLSEPVTAEPPSETLKVASSLMYPVSLTPTGLSSSPIIVKVRVAVSVPPFPSLIVYVNVSVPVSPGSRASAAA